jgi:hypothetical protein
MAVLNSPTEFGLDSEKIMLRSSSRFPNPALPFSPTHIKKLCPFPKQSQLRAQVNSTIVRHV